MLERKPKHAFYVCVGFVFLVSLYPVPKYAGVDAYKELYIVVCILFYSIECICGPGNLVGIATGYGQEGPGIKSLWG
jgi:hypothetical protein